MKRILVLLLAVCILFSLSACNKEIQDNNSSADDLNSSVTETSQSVLGDCTHIYEEWIVQREATCQQDGAKSRICKNCNYVETEILKQLEHTIVVDKGKSATCTNNGFKDGKHCSACNSVIVAQEPILATGHTYDNNKDKTCNSCKFKRILNCKHQNQFTVKGQVATCTSSGFTDGKMCKDCETIITKQETVAAKGHTATTDKAVSPTCTKTGLTTGKHCSACNYIIEPQSIVNATGHNWGDWKVIKDSTATTEGTSQRKCNNCSATESKSIAKKEYSIKLSKTQITVEEGLESEKIGIDFSVSDIKDYHVSFSQTNEIVGISWNASLEDGFYVRGNKPGTTTITITNSDMPGASATLKVTVTPKTTVEGISLDQTHIDGKVGYAYHVIATITPANAQEKYVTWKSSNENVATVFAPAMQSQEASISAVGVGTATITATTYDGGFVASCNITVTAIPIERIEITTSTKLNYYKGETLQLNYRILPYDATDRNQKVIWSSDNTEIATVDSNGLITFIKGIAFTNVTITVTTADGKYTDYVRLYCVPDKTD